MDLKLASYFSTTNWKIEYSTHITFTMTKKIADLYSFSFFVFPYVKQLFHLYTSKDHKPEFFLIILWEYTIGTLIGSKIGNVHFCLQLF